MASILPKRPIQTHAIVLIYDLYKRAQILIVLLTDLLIHHHNSNATFLKKRYEQNKIYVCMHLGAPRI